MAKTGTNSARRVLRILEAGRQRPDSSNYSHTLAELMGCDPGVLASANLPRLAAQYQEATCKQIDRAERLLRDMDFDSELFASYFNAARDALQPHLVASSWSPFKASVTGEVLLAFRWSAFALENDGLETDPEALLRFQASLEALLNDPFFSRLPADVRTRLEEAISGALAAMRMAPVDGGESAFKAAEGLVAEAKSDADLIVDLARESEDGRNFLRKMRDMAGKWADAVPKILDGVARNGDRAAKIAKLASDAKGWIGSMFEALPPPG